MDQVSDFERRREKALEELEELEKGGFDVSELKGFMKKIKNPYEYKPDCIFKAYGAYLY